MLIGTVAYMSPEQIKAETVSSASDMFSLGVIFYEMATGRRPFKGGAEVAVMYKIVYDDPPAPATVDRGPSALRSTRSSSRMLAKNPDDRPTRGRRRGRARRQRAAYVGRIALHRRAVEHPAVGANTVGRSSRSAHDCARPFSRQRRPRADAVRDGRGRSRQDHARRGISVRRSSTLTRPAVIARGRCSERLAGAEAYLPFLEALDSLIRGNPSIARVMKTMAPSWYVQLAIVARRVG